MRGSEWCGMVFRRVSTRDLIKGLDSNETHDMQRGKGKKAAVKELLRLDVKNDASRWFVDEKV